MICMKKIGYIFGRFDFCPYFRGVNETALTIVVEVVTLTTKFRDSFFISI